MEILDRLQEKLEYKQSEIDDKQYEIDNFELDESDYIQQFDDMLDETNEALFGILPSRIMSTIDPIMYNTELGYYVDSLEVSDDPNYQELVDELEELNNELEAIEEEIEEIENN